MLNPESATLRDLPRVTAAHALPGHAARLTFADGTEKTISSAQPRAFLWPLPAHLGAVFVEDWGVLDPAVYFVPAHALPAFRAALHLTAGGQA